MIRVSEQWLVVRGFRKLVSVFGGGGGAEEDLDGAIEEEEEGSCSWYALFQLFRWILL